MTQGTDRRGTPLPRRGTVAAALLASLAAAPAAGQDAPRPGLTLRQVVETTLARSAQIAQGEWDVQSQLGSLQQAAGAFDPQAHASVTTDRRRTPTFGSGETGPGSSLARNLGYGAGVDWRLRSGLSLSPNLSFNRVDVDAAGLPRNTGVASLDLVMPLLRGRGGGSARAGEVAAAENLDASQADLRHLRASSVLSAVNAYWGYVAAARTLAVLRESEGRSRRLLEQTEKLIEADERPAAERVTSAANLASKRAATLAGENALATARQALAEAMGLPADQLAALPLAADAFPALPDSAAAAAWPADAEWVALALRERADLAAARKRRSAAGALLRGTRSEIRSRLDLNLGVGYTGIEAGGEFDRLVAPFYSSQGGFQAEMGFTYGLPLGRRATAGQLLRSSAADRRAALAADELARTISLAVATAAETLRRTVEELRLTAEAVTLHTASVESESQKFQLGTATLFDVIQSEDGLTGATVGWINAQRRFAGALAQLRFLTGTLVGGERGDAVDAAGLATWAGIAAAPR
ncbi:MAG TPA: TolC family protein [Longimicrobiaceae bacterium]|nr:TolC family protein [Longimicrobiaceae bacterium]